VTPSPTRTKRNGILKYKTLKYLRKLRLEETFGILRTYFKNKLNWFSSIQKRSKNKR